MKAVLWGTRGSVARAGPETVSYGGDTACVEVRTSDGQWLILDAGTGLLRVTPRIPDDCGRIDILLTHLHMDHIQGLGFFYPLRAPEIETHIWGPISTTLRLAERLNRYLSPPLFPVRVRDFRSTYLHDVEPGSYEIGSARISADLVVHPDPTVGYRIEENGSVLAYLPDHEPALGNPTFPSSARWTSGFSLAEEADVLIHDAQYTEAEYVERVGWGHSTLEHALSLAELAGVDSLVPFHHDPEHSDDMLDALIAGQVDTAVPITPGKAGTEFDLT